MNMYIISTLSTSRAGETRFAAFVKNNFFFISENSFLKGISNNWNKYDYVDINIEYNNKMYEEYKMKYIKKEYQFR